jgi:hypothetical protein
MDFLTLSRIVCSALPSVSCGCTPLISIVPPSVIYQKEAKGESMREQRDLIYGMMVMRIM